MLKKIAKKFFQIKGYYPVKLNGRTFKGDPYHIGFWRIANRGGFEPEYFRLLEKYLDKDTVYCDIESWIGPTIMYASALCKKVYCFEPDPIAYQYLLNNIELNRLSNITPFKSALCNFNGNIKMASHGGNQGDSMSSLVNIDQLENTISVRAITWDTWCHQYNPGKIDFIKIDIEGGEVLLIPKMTDYLLKEKPTLHFS